MKRNLFHVVTLAITFSFLSSCIGYTQKEEIRKTGSFSEITLSIPADVFLTQGPRTEVKLEGPENYLGKVETKVKGDRLSIAFYHNYFGWRRPQGRIAIYITTPEIKRLNVTGSGKIETKTQVSSDELKLLVTGSGKIKVSDLLAKRVDVSVTGSGTIKLAGKEPVISQEVEITGSGTIHNENLPTKKAEASITGSGDAYVYVNDRLKVSITGSGDLYYAGAPVVDARITGSGNVKALKEK